MKKRFTALALILCMLVCSLSVGCDVNSNDSGDITSDTDTQINLEGDPLIVYTYGMSARTSVLIEKYNKYCAIYDDYSYRIEVKNFTEFEQFNYAITTELMAGKGPDVFFLDAPLPFEKMAENGSLLDINELIKEKGSDISFDDFNQVIMDTGVFDGKRYILPVFYCVDTLFSTQDRLDALGIDPDSITYEKLAELKKSGASFIFTDNPDGYTEEIFLHCIVREFADFREKETYFDTEEFNNVLDAIDILYESTDSEETDYFFENTNILTLPTYSLIYSYQGCAPYSVAERFIIQQELGKDLVLLPAYSRNGEVSAYAEAGIAVNANTDKTDKVMKLVEFLLSDNTQAYHCGALRKERNNYSGTCSLPVRNSILDKAFQVELEDVYGSESDSEYTEPEALVLQPIINEKKNTFLSEKLRPLVDSVSRCTIYDYRTTQLSYYNLNIIGSIIDNYMNGTISRDKFIVQLESATKTYMKE